jgi:hypothetical protein
MTSTTTWHKEIHLYSQFWPHNLVIAADVINNAAAYNRPT